VRTPTNTIMNAIESLRRCLPTAVLQAGGSPQELLEMIEVNARDIATLCADLLELNLRADPPRQDAPIGDIVHSAIHFSRDFLRDIDLRVTLDYEGNVLCSRQLLLHSLANLLQNAALATGPSGRIELHVFIDGAELVICVLDNGPGVPVELRERIFEPFFTTRGPTTGTGLGLTLSRAAVHKHGGSLRVCELRGMTAFEIRIPLRRALPTGAEETSIEPRMVDHGAQHHSDGWKGGGLEEWCPIPLALARRWNQ
jgi:signal transduction histidine kinase